MKIEFEFDRQSLSNEEIARFIGEITETMVLRNMQYLEKFPRLRLFDTTIHYVLQSHSPWRDIPFTLKTGHGDCKSIVPWRIAELRFLGESALAQVVVLGDEAQKFHLNVVRQNGAIEDTSALLGMGKARSKRSAL